VKRTSFLLAGLLLGASLVAQAAIPTGRQQTGCATPPIALQVTNAGGSTTFQPIPAGYGTVLGIYYVYIPGFIVPLPAVDLVMPWGSAPWAPCCHPGPAIRYASSTYLLSPFESWTIQIPPGLFGLHVWVQGLLWRSPQGVPCQTYVTNQIEVVLQ